MVALTAEAKSAWYLSRTRQRQDQMVSLVERMLTLHQQLSAANTSTERNVFQRQIDATDSEIYRLVYDELYGIRKRLVMQACLVLVSLASDCLACTPNTLSVVIGDEPGVGLPCTGSDRFLLLRVRMSWLEEQPD